MNTDSLRYTLCSAIMSSEIHKSLTPESYQNITDYLKDDSVFLGQICFSTDCDKNTVRLLVTSTGDVFTNEEGMFSSTTDTISVSYDGNCVVEPAIARKFTNLLNSVLDYLETIETVKTTTKLLYTTAQLLEKEKSAELAQKLALDALMIKSAFLCTSDQLKGMRVNNVRIVYVSDCQVKEGTYTINDYNNKSWEVNVSAERWSVRRLK